MRAQILTAGRIEVYAVIQDGTIVLAKLAAVATAADKTRALEDAVSRLHLEFD